MLEARGLDLERADPVAGRDDHIVRTAHVPVVPVLVLHGGVLRVEPLPAEGLRTGRVISPVAERIVGVGSGAEADLAAFALCDRALVLVEQLHVPARHRLAHRALAHVEPWIVGDERIRLREAVVVEHGDAVLLPEPADRLGIQGLSSGAHPAEALRIPASGVFDRHHRAHRGRGREDVRDPVAAEEVELLVRVEAAFTAVHALHGPETPGTEQRGDAGSPRPFAHPVESFAVLRPRGSRGTPRGRGCSGVRGRCPSRGPSCPTCSRAGPDRRPPVSAQMKSVGAAASVSCSSTSTSGRPRAVEPRRVLGVGDEQQAPESESRCSDAVVAVEHRHREQDRAELPDAEEDRGRLGGRRAARRRRGRPRHARGQPAYGRPGSRDPAALPSRARASSRRSSPRSSPACLEGACRTRPRRCCTATEHPSDGRRTSRRTSCRPYPCLRRGV